MSVILLLTVIVEITVMIILYNADYDDEQDKNISYIPPEDMKKIRVVDL